MPKGRNTKTKTGGYRNTSWGKASKAGGKRPSAKLFRPQKNKSRGK